MNEKKKVPLARLLTSDRWANLTVSILSILLMLATSSVILLLMGKNPIVAFQSFLQGCGFLPKAKYGGGSGMLSDFFDFLNILAPMILAALAFIVAFKTGLFNIGISGQMLLSGFMATIMVGYIKDLSPWIAKPLVILIGILTGGALGALIGFLKYRFNIHEVVSTIMVNYIISYTTGFFINTRYVDMLTRSSRICTPVARLTWTKVMVGSVSCNIPLGIVLAVVAVFVVKFIFDRTVFGFELKAVGTSRKCARYIGVNVQRSIILSMAFSGIFAGLAGVTYYLGYTNTMVPKVLPGMGYDSIAVALLGNSSPVGAIFASVIVTIFQSGANYMSSSVGVAKEIASLITGILLLFAACGEFMKALGRRRIEKIEDARIAEMQKARAKEEGLSSGGIAARASGNGKQESGTAGSGVKQDRGTAGTAGSGVKQDRGIAGTGAGKETGQIRDNGKKGGNDR